MAVLHKAGMYLSPHFFLFKSFVILVFIILWVRPVSGLGEKQISAEMIAAHNAVRAKLDLPGLAWSEELAEHAREWAVYLAEQKDCRMEHRPQDGKYARQYGENIYWASPIRYSDGTREIRAVSAEAAVAEWVGEAKNFDYGANRCREGRVCGHYTQVVWRATERVGCARAVCPDKGQLWVCNYDPAGNIVGQQPY